MTAEQKKLVQSSFLGLLPNAEAFVTRFYCRLFEIDPTLKPLFQVEISEQERKLLDMWTIAVNSLSHPAQLLPALQRLGERHIEYGVKPEHYETLRVALFWAFEQEPAERCIPPIRAAWQAVHMSYWRTSSYKLLSNFPRKPPF